MGGTVTGGICGELLLSVAIIIRPLSLSLPVPKESCTVCNSIGRQLVGNFVGRWGGTRGTFQLGNLWGSGICGETELVGRILDTKAIGIFWKIRMQN
jgi:hypothetical protein